MTDGWTEDGRLYHNSSSAVQLHKGWLKIAIQKYICYKWFNLKWIILWTTIHFHQWAEWVVLKCRDYYLYKCTCTCFTWQLHVHILRWVGLNDCILYCQQYRLGALYDFTERGLMGLLYMRRPAHYLVLLDFVSRAHGIALCPSSVIRPFVHRPSIHVAIISELSTRISSKF